MATAEDDEIVLQEVIVDRSDVRKPSIQRSGSLQIPGTSPDFPKPKEPVFSRLRGLSPKIAPKFPREKLKSMFRKRKLSSAFPFYKLKGVRFTKDTKEDVHLLNQSLLGSSHDAIDVEITLSTPELTETEKETGVHPYYYTQQTITSVKQLATGQAVAMRQPSITRSESEENKFKGHKMGKYLVRSSSVPNICHPDEHSHYVHDPIIESSLKKLSETMKNKRKLKKSKTKKKSPPPKQIQQTDDSSGDGEDTGAAPSVEPESRRSTLPEITVTKCGSRGSEQLDLAISSISEQPSDHNSDSKRKDSQEKRDSIPEIREPQSSKISQSIAEAPSPKITVETTPELHSTSEKSRKTPPKQTRIVAPEPKDGTKRKTITRKSPPPKRPEKLTFIKPVPTKKIAGIALKSDKAPSSPTSESDSSTPVLFIPSTFKVGRIPHVPQPDKPAIRESSTSPQSSPTTSVPISSIQYPTTRADTAITIGDSKEDLQQIITEQTCPPEPPQRHIPRAGSKGKK